MFELYIYMYKCLFIERQNFHRENNKKYWKSFNICLISTLCIFVVIKIHFRKSGKLVELGKTNETFWNNRNSFQAKRNYYSRNPQRFILSWNHSIRSYTLTIPYGAFQTLLWVKGYHPSSRQSIQINDEIHFFSKCFKFLW